jgi:cbb3-type cytochrome oxidase subunit 1
MSDQRSEHALIRAHGIAALAMVIVSALFGTLVAVKFVLPNFLGGAAWTTWGRLRYNHTQGILFGFLGDAFFAFLYHAVPSLAERPVRSPRLGW